MKLVRFVRLAFTMVWDLIFVRFVDILNLVQLGLASRPFTLYILACRPPSVRLSLSAFTKGFFMCSCVDSVRRARQAFLLPFLLSVCLSFWPSLLMEFGSGEHNDRQQQQQQQSAISSPAVNKSSLQLLPDDFFHRAVVFAVVFAALWGSTSATVEQE